MSLDLGIDLSNVTDIGVGKVNDQVLHDGPRPIFIIKTVLLGPHTWAMSVDVVKAVDQDNKPYETEHYLDGGIMFDGRSTWEFQDKLEWSDYNDLAKHVQLMMYLYEYAATAIINADPNGFQFRG